MTVHVKELNNEVLTDVEMGQILSESSADATVTEIATIFDNFYHITEMGQNISAGLVHPASYSDSLRFRPQPTGYYLHFICGFLGLSKQIRS